MTDERDQFLRDLEAIERQTPQIPGAYGELRQLLARLPAPTLPDIKSARTGTDQQATQTGFGASQSPLAGAPPGSDSGGAIGVLPQLFYGKSNMLGDPMMWRLGSGITGAAFVNSDLWRVRHILNSGILPAIHSWDGRADRVSDANSPLNSDASSFSVNGFNAAGCDLTLLIKDSSNTDGFDTIDAAPYMIGAVRLPLVLGFGSTYTNITSVTVTVELIDDLTGTVYATSTPFDYKAWDIANSNGAEVRLTAPYLNTVARRLEWQLRVRIVSTGAGGSIVFLFGEPQQTHSSTELAPPFSPIIGAWVPQEIVNREFSATTPFIQARLHTDASNRVEISVDGSYAIGSGAATADVRLSRSAAKVLRLDDAAGARASLEGAAGVGPGSPGAGFGRLYFSSATKSWHQVDDAGVDKDLASPTGALAAHVSWDAAAAAADYVARIRLSTDTTFRAFLGLTAADEGSLELGPGGVAARDTRLVRAGAGAIKFDTIGAAAATAFNVESTAGQRSLVQLQVVGDSFNRVRISGDATLVGVELGSGAAARDLRAYRSAAKTATVDDTAGGAITLNVIGALQQGGVGVSLVGHGPADHADITRSFLLVPTMAGLDTATLIALGASPNLSQALNYADAATQGAYWTFVVPIDCAGTGLLNIQPLWSPGASDAVAHTVRWSVGAKNVNGGADVTAAGTTTAFTGSSAARTVNVMVSEAAQSTGLTPAAGDRIRILLQRIGADAADTYVGAVRLLGLLVNYTANQ